MVTSDLPLDLVAEILSRVPKTSLGRLKFTCKRWNDLLNDPEFIKKQNSVLMFNDLKVYSLRVNLNEINKSSIEFTSEFSRSLNESEKVEITQVFHCNGLLLYSMKETNKTKFLVVNLYTGQTRRIKPSRCYYDRYFLGYENNNDKSYESYKILRFPHDCKQLEIFELKSNSWRVLANIPLCNDLRTIGRGVSLKGNTYWISSFWSKFDILSFDFTSERFNHLCLPCQILGSNTIALSVVREDQLSLLHGRLDTQQMEIWVSSNNKIDDTETVFSWSISVTLDLHSQFDHLFSEICEFINR